MKPKYATEFSAGADLCASESVTINPGEFKLVPTGYYGNQEDYADCGAMLLFARSSLSIKKGLILANGVGLIDCDYMDEVKVILTNITDNPARIEQGERIAQLLPIAKNAVANVASWGVGVDLRQGGFGSTGGYNGYNEAVKAGVYES